MTIRDRLNADTLEIIRAALDARGFGGDFHWAESVRFPKSPDTLTSEYAWVICNSGMKAAVARGIYAKLWPVVVSGGSASETFGHAGKAAAIDRGWTERGAWWLEARELEGQALLDWCQSRPWIGKITRYHLAKNLGADCAKPDIWLVRLAESHGETVDGLCGRLAAGTGWRVGAVDVLLWRACAEGLLTPTPGGARLQVAA